MNHGALGERHVQQRLVASSEGPITKVLVSGEIPAWRPGHGRVVSHPLASSPSFSNEVASRRSCGCRGFGQCTAVVKIVAPRGNPGVAPRAVALRMTAPRTWHLLGLCGCHRISRFFGERGAPNDGGSCASLTLFVTTRSTDAQDPTGAFPGVWVKEGTSPSAIDVLLRAAAAVWSQCPAEFSLFQERSAAQARAVGSHQQLAVTVKYGRLVQAHGLRWRPVTLLPHQSSGVGFACSAYKC